MEIDKEQIEKKKSQLKGLFKDLSDEELTQKAVESIEKKERAKEVAVEGLFVNPYEKKYANELLAKYLKEFTIETISDKNTLNQLIYLEIINNRLQNTLNTTYNDSKHMDKDTLELVHKNQDKIIALKSTLGLVRDKKKEDSRDAFGYLQIVKKKFKIWLQENQASRTMTCPFCSKMIYLKMKTDAWEAQKHPFFKDRVLSNVHLLKLYVQKKLTKEDLAKIFETSTDYIDWLVDKWTNNPDYKKLLLENK